MADSLSDSIDVSALERYDKLALRIARDRFADTVALHNALSSGDVVKSYQEAGLAPVCFAEVERFASEQGNLTGDVDSMLNASVWQVNLNVQFDAQKAATTMQWMMLTLMLLLLLLLSHLQMQLKVLLLLLLLLSNLMQALVLLLLQ